MAWSVGVVVSECLEEKVGMHSCNRCFTAYVRLVKKLPSRSQSLQKPKLHCRKFGSKLHAKQKISRDSGPQRLALRLAEARLSLAAHLRVQLGPQNRMLRDRSFWQAAHCDNPVAAGLRRTSAHLKPDSGFRRTSKNI